MFHILTIYCNSIKIINLSDFYFYLTMLSSYLKNLRSRKPAKVKIKYFQYHLVEKRFLWNFQKHSTYMPLLFAVDLRVFFLQLNFQCCLANRMRTSAAINKQLKWKYNFQVVYIPGEMKILREVRKNSAYTSVYTYMCKCVCVCVCVCGFDPIKKVIYMHTRGYPYIQTQNRENSSWKSHTYTHTHTHVWMYVRIL